LPGVVGGLPVAGVEGREARSARFGVAIAIIRGTRNRDIVEFSEYVGDVLSDGGVRSEQTKNSAFSPFSKLFC